MDNERAPRRLTVLLVALVVAGITPGAADATKKKGPVEPFALRSVEEVWLDVPKDYANPGAGTIKLQGWIALPDVPPGVRVPVVMTSHPYLGHVGGGGGRETPDDPAFFSDTPGGGAMYNSLGLKPKTFIERGYAMAIFTVRGSGGSGGCFDFFGPNEQRDQVSVIEWLARQSWSNGKVGMAGLSYSGTTPLEAAIYAPEALKTIVVGGIVSDLYTFIATPQGAYLSAANGLSATYNLLFGIAPPVGGEPQTAAQRPLDQRVCDDGVDHSTSTHLTERHEPVWDARRLIDGFDRVRASVLMFHGLGDSLARDGTSHGPQDDWAWQALSRAPKRHIMGQWGHVYPTTCASSVCADGKFPAGWRESDWKSVTFAWLDYYLKGIGDKPDRLGTVDYQDTSGAWHASREWPPREARDEVLYLADDKLATAPGGARRSFAAVNSPSTTWALTTVLAGAASPEGTLCPRPSDAAVATGLLYSTPAVTAPTLIAGNPFAYLHLDSTQGGGIVSAALVDIGPDFACDATGTPSDVRLMTAGAADLQYHSGGFTPKDFPTATATPVRLDFENIVVKLAPGHRVGLLLLGPVVHAGEPYAPTIGINSPPAADSSQLVLPIVEGGFGGAEPKIDYPPRPFLPAPKDPGGGGGGGGGSAKEPTDGTSNGTNSGSGASDDETSGSSGSDDTAAGSIAQAAGAATPFTGAQIGLLLLIAGAAIAGGTLLAFGRVRRPKD